MSAAAWALLKKPKRETIEEPSVAAESEEEAKGEEREKRGREKKRERGERGRRREGRNGAGKMFGRKGWGKHFKNWNKLLPTGKKKKKKAKKRGVHGLGLQKLGPFFNARNEKWWSNTFRRLVSSLY